MAFLVSARQGACMLVRLQQNICRYSKTWLLLQYNLPIVQNIDVNAMPVDANRKLFCHLRPVRSRPLLPPACTRAKSSFACLPNKPSNILSISRDCKQIKLKCQDHHALRQLAIEDFTKGQENSILLGLYLCHLDIIHTYDYS